MSGLMKKTCQKHTLGHYFTNRNSHEDNNLGFGIFEKVDKDLGLSRGTAWDASGWKDYCDFGFGDV